MFTFDQAQPGEWMETLKLAFQPMPAESRPEAVLETLSLLLAGTLDPAGLRVARQGASIVGVQVCVPLGGSCCLFWLPCVRAGWDISELPEHLVAAGIAWSRTQRHKLGQLLIALDQEALAAPFLRQGFRLVTKLETLRHDLSGVPAQPPSALRFETFHDSRRAPFEQVLQHTYEGTLDCPELNGVRTMGEIVAGHRAAGKFRPERWWLAYVEQEPVGVVLLNERADDCLTWELAYLGIVPTYRRRGYGRLLTLHALQTARRQAVSQLTVAIDVRNRPAKHLYTSLGFTSEETRLVYLAFFPQAHGPD